MAYITPRVKFELGARGDPWPTEEKVIRPHAADDYPDFFEDPDTSVTVLSARRTFWEKATALHAEAHRPAESPTPQYFSRHYYDLAMLLDTGEGKAAAADFDLLAQVAKHNATFFRSGWASYDTARPGTLRLLPDDARIKDLRALPGDGADDVRRYAAFGRRYTCENFCASRNDQQLSRDS